jgi:putative peptidoglycan lipid II flippase
VTEQPAAGTSSGRVPRRLGVATAIFAAATGLSRVAGLVREVVAASYFGTLGAASAFTFAFQLPNLVRALVADAALSSAFVPVFSELLEQKRRKEATALAGALFGLILVVLTALTLLFIALAGVIVPAFTGSDFTPALDDLTVGLTQLLFPIVVLLGLNGLVVGILNAHDHFSVPAIAPLVWNLVIIAALVVLTPLFTGDDRIYAYAIGVLAGTVVQFAMALPVLTRIGFPLKPSLRFRDPRILQVLKLMLPVTISLGLINVDLLVNTTLGFRISKEVPRAIEFAFRIYMLPQGLFSVAVATVLFPALSRLAARRDLVGLRATTGVGVRQITLLLVPAAAALLALSVPITRLVYERGAFDAGSTELAARALYWFAFSLPFAGVNLLLTRTFFSLRRPWIPTALALFSLVVNVVVSLLTYRPLGIAGVVLGTVSGSVAMTAGQAWLLSRELEGLEAARTSRAVVQILIASAALGGAAYAAWFMLDDVLGRSFVAQAVSVGAALGIGTALYAGLVLVARIPEAEQILRLFSARLRRGSS